MIEQLRTKSLALVDAPLEVRLQTFAHFFLNIKYGQWADGSSLETLDDFNYQLDVLDCVTYVELVLALAKSHPSADFIDLLRHIHYANGVPSFIARNHFMCLDWMQNNKYLLEDTTCNVSRNVQVAEAVIDKLNWLMVAKKITDIPVYLHDALQPQISRIPYIPTLELLDNQTRYFNAFPEYSIVCIVRPNWDLTAQIGTHLNISHLGFVFKDHVTRTLRFYHASGATLQSEVNSAANNPDSYMQFKVVTIDLCEYMARYIQSPTIRGFNVLAISPEYYHAR